MGTGTTRAHAQKVADDLIEGYKNKVRHRRREIHSNYKTQKEKHTD
jgi:ribosome recycling factor